MTGWRKVFASDVRAALRLPGKACWRRIARLWALSFGALVVWSRLSVFFHEAAGHAFVWRAWGGEIERIEVALFGGGHVWTSAEPPGGYPVFLFLMAGIFLNALLGAALVVAVFRGLAKGRALALHVLAWGAVLNVAGATHYAALGAFHGFGDPAPYGWLWGPSLALLVCGMPVALSLWARTLKPLLSVGGRPLGLTGVLVAAVPLAAYLGGLALEGRSFATLRAEDEALARLIAQKREERLAAWRAEHGDEPPPPGFVEVGEKEIERPFPLTAVVLALDALFLGAVLLRRGGEPAEPAEPAERERGELKIPWLTPLLAAGVVLLVCQVLF